MKNKTVDTLIITLLLFFVISTPIIWVFQSNMEATVYNRETNSNITTWEAMWTNLRVDCK